MHLPLINRCLAGCVLGSLAEALPTQALTVRAALFTVMWSTVARQQSAPFALLHLDANLTRLTLVKESSDVDALDMVCAPTVEMLYPNWD